MPAHRKWQALPPQDETTLYCITVDFDTVGDLEGGCVTVRDRHHGAGPSIAR